MQKYILVATPQTAFGELLRLSLEELGNYQVYQVQTSEQALANANRMNYGLAILDADLRGLGLPSLVQALRYFHPDIRLIVIPPENNHQHPSLAELKADGYLDRPFYIPDMIEIVDKTLAAVSPQPPDRSSRKQSPAETDEPQKANTASLPWLKDADLAARRLTGLMNDSAAHVTLIAHNGDLWARAGRLDKTASQEIVTLLDRYWDEDEKSDLARFIRLNSNKNEYLLYATLLVDDLVLAAAYDPYTPITRIRSQIVLTARALAVPPVPPEPGETAAGEVTAVPSEKVVSEPLPEAPLPAPGFEAVLPEVQAAAPQMNVPEPAAAAQPAAPQAVITEPGVSVQATQPVYENPPPEFATIPATQPIAVSSPKQAPGPVEILSGPEDTAADDLTGDEDNTPLDEISQISLAELLASMPSPDPETIRRPVQSDWAANGGKPAFISAPTAYSSTDPAERAETRTEEKITTPNSMPVFTEPPNLLARFEGADLEQAQTDSLADTRPMLLGPPTQLSDLEPVSAAYSRLSYTCLLVPRMPYHYLTGELADRLNQWLTHCCLAFGWRLEGLAIRPDYMQWIVQVSPAISPGNLVRIVRQRTSQYIFSHYPQINFENPSGDFWAPGYLILSGSQLPTTQMLREFIVQTRQRQGIKSV
jgi:REP element-mobilizing transposase RayT/DNA-binding response OmpR family regulator